MKAFVVFAFASVALSAPRKCDIRAVDQCLGRALPFANNSMIQDFEQKCMKGREGVNCLVDYAKAECLKGDALNALKLLLSGTASECALTCQPGTDNYDAYFKYMGCSNKYGELIHKCMRKATAYIEAAAISGGPFRGSLTCCAFDCLSTCLGEAAEKQCPEQIGAKDYFQGVVKSVSGKFIAAQCGAYQLGAPECKNLPQLTIGEPKYTTIYGPLLEFLSLQ
ncbi:uncharacterized protein LOC111264775 [Varroa jacobsoni]|uniref:uncharacterized protein LOC111264775 n=1 Tax=Varroa jacobsoni TaxID=62625 RepID=UPI000BF96CC0|nr:uncharacterized protein LOC111264775 [Varroa jacobsoni]